MRLLFFKIFSVTGYGIYFRLEPVKNGVIFRFCIPAYELVWAFSHHPKGK